MAYEVEREFGVDAVQDGVELKVEKGHESTKHTHRHSTPKVRCS